LKGETASFEVLDTSNFSDPKIVIFCEDDDDLEPKALKPTCVTKNGDVSFGEILILGTNNSLSNLCNLAQVKIVKQELKLHPKQPNLNQKFNASLGGVE